MSNTYNLYNLEPQFKNFLLAENVSNLTLTNYLSDFRHFAAWFEAKIRSTQSADFWEQINFETITQYKKYLFTSSIPLKSINRRLSTLRKFCSFAITQGWLNHNPAKQVQNAKQELMTEKQTHVFEEVLTLYYRHLIKEKGVDSAQAVNQINLIKEFFSL
jgi:site-specific recombinase XerD